MAGLADVDCRASAVGVDMPFVRLYNFPDGTISQGDRQNIAMKYACILASAGVGRVFTLPLLGVG